MADEAIEGPAEPSLFAVFPDRQQRHVSRAPPVEIACAGMVDRVGPAPDVIGRQRHDPDHAADPVAETPVAEQGAVPAIVLDHEQPNQKGRVRQRQGQRQYGADRQRPPGHRPYRDERHKCDGQFEDAAGGDGLAIVRQRPRPVLRGRRGLVLRRAGGVSRARRDLRGWQLGRGGLTLRCERGPVRLRKGGADIAVPDGGAGRSVPVTGRSARVTGGCERRCHGQSRVLCSGRVGLTAGERSCRR